MGDDETIVAKVQFKELLWEIAAAEFSHLHSDNDIFSADMLCDDCKQKNQSQRLSGVGAKNQYAMAKCAIQTFAYMAWFMCFSIGLSNKSLI